jgi:hypothetical protein
MRSKSCDVRPNSARTSSFGIAKWLRDGAIFFAASIMMVPITIKSRLALPFYAPLNAHCDAALGVASANA